MVEEDTGVDLKTVLRADVRGLCFWYGEKRIVNAVDLPIYDSKVTALIGPSGCGKTTLLRCFNRMHDLYTGNRYGGEIRIFPEDVNLLSSELDPIDVRMRVGMVFQKPNPFPKSIFENVAYGLRIKGIKNSREIEESVERALVQAGLWDEVRDRLATQAMSLSGGQQQRLCIARALATQPEILLLDEPTSALDPISTAHIESLVQELKKTVTIIMVTHNLQQAARVADYTGFMYLGDLIEYGSTKELFAGPKNERTQRYISGAFG